MKVHRQVESVTGGRPCEAFHLEKGRRKSLGAFYTPPEIVAYMCQESLIRFLDQSLNRDKQRVPRRTIEALIRQGALKGMAPHARLIDDRLAGLTCCDPAVGMGAFLVGMLETIVQARCALNSCFKNAPGRSPCHFKRHALRHCLYGVDIDPEAVETARLRLCQSLALSGAGGAKAKLLARLGDHIRIGDALLGLEGGSKSEAQPSKAGFGFKRCFAEVFNQGGFDLVVGNPPYLFLTGKGSPVRQLVRANRLVAAKKLKARYDLYSQRFPASSRGCRDFYKWFTELAFRIARPGGVVGYVTPNTFLTLKHYTDVRELLFERHATDLVIDLGFDVFETPLVPAAVFIARRAPREKSSVRYCDLKGIERASLKERSLARLVDRHVQMVAVKEGELLRFKHPLAEKLYRSCSATLRDFAVISEGEHDMVLAAGRISRKASADAVPVVDDAQLSRFHLLKVVYLPRADCPGFNRALHSGERFFLRKTGDRIVAAPPARYGLAVAHQNVYVVHPKPGGASVELLLGLLNSSLLTFLYQNGAYGQKGRTLAQFRIYALYLLPFPRLTGPLAQAIERKVAQVLNLKRRASADQTGALEREIDRLVYRLYRLSAEDIAAVEQADLLPAGFALG